MLTPEQLQQYSSDGYVLIPDVVDANTLAQIRTVVCEFLERSREHSASDEIYDLAPDHSSQSPRVRRLKDPHLRHDVFHQLAMESPIVDIVAPLLGGTVRFDHSKLNFKPRATDARIEWHQDWAFYPHTNDNILAVGVMLEDCTHDNGPLLVVPGSHRGPVYDHHHDGWFAGGVAPDLAAEFSSKAVALTGKAGSITVHHVRTLHASGNNLTDSLRPLLLYSYTAVDAFPVFERYEIAEYDSRILRGQATRVPRMEALPLRIAHPRVEGADSIFDDQFIRG